MNSFNFCPAKIKVRSAMLTKMFFYMWSGVSLSREYSFNIGEKKIKAIKKILKCKKLYFAFFQHNTRAEFIIIINDDIFVGAKVYRHIKENSINTNKFFEYFNIRCLRSR